MSEENTSVEVKDDKKTEKAEETKFARISIEGGSKKFAFLMEEGAGFGESYDAAYSVLSHLLEAIKKSADNFKPKKPEEKANVEEKEVKNEESNK